MWDGVKSTRSHIFYAGVMGFSLFKHFDDADISTEYSALMYKVMSNSNGRIKFPVDKPARGKKIPDRGIPGRLSRSRRAAHRLRNG